MCPLDCRCFQVVYCIPVDPRRSAARAWIKFDFVFEGEAIIETPFKFYCGDYDVGGRRKRREASGCNWFIHPSAAAAAAAVYKACESRNCFSVHSVADNWGRIKYISLLDTVKNTFA